MGISRLTAYAIATRDDIVITTGGPAKKTEEYPEYEGKYAGWITLGEEDNYRPLLNTLPIYSSVEEATKAMQDIVAEIKTTVEKELDGRDIITTVMEESAKKPA